MPKQGLDSTALHLTKENTKPIIIKTAPASQPFFKVPRKRALSNTPLSPKLAMVPVSLDTLDESKNAMYPGHKAFVMRFCPKCGALLELGNGKSAEIFCRKCKYRTKLQQERILEKRTIASHRIRTEIAVLGAEESKLRTLPLVRTICPACNNDASETWTVAIGSEGTHGITFLRCTACGYTSREAE